MDGLGLYDVVGLIGTILVVVAYFATQQGWLEADDLRFPLANLVGAVLILVSLSVNWNLAAAVMEGFWLAISIYGLARSWRGRARG